METFIFTVAILFTTTTSVKTFNAFWNINSLGLVDDSKSARAVLKRMLNGLKLEVDTVESATDAIDYLDNAKI